MSVEGLGRERVAELLPALVRGLDDLGCGALVVFADSGRDPDLAPFSGPVHLGRTVLVAPRGGDLRLAFLSPMEREEAAAAGLVLLAPETLEIERLTRETDGRWGALLAAVTLRALALSGVAPGPVAVAGHGAAGNLYTACTALGSAGWPVRSGAELILTLRKHKPAWQLADVRRSAAGAAAALRRVAGLLAAATAVDDGELWLGGERLRTVRLRREIAGVLAAHALDQPAGNIVAAGGDGAVPHTAGGDDRVLRAGEPVVVDLYPRGALLFADCTRTFCAGRAPEAVVAAHREVAAALARARAAARPGVRAFELQEMVCGLFAAAGRPTSLSHPGTADGYVHNLGHGVGFALHEYPSFRKETGAEGLLAAGDVFTLEPGLYDPVAGWGVRLEDLLVLGVDGAETLTPLPLELDPKAWGEG